MVMSLPVLVRTCLREGGDPLCEILYVHCMTYLGSPYKWNVVFDILVPTMWFHLEIILYPDLLATSLATTFVIYSYMHS